MSAPVLGHVVREQRIAAGLSLRALGHASGLSAVDLGRIERGVWVPPPTKLAAIFANIADAAPDDRAEGRTQEQASTLSADDRAQAQPLARIQDVRKDLVVAAQGKACSAIYEIQRYGDIVAARRSWGAMSEAAPPPWLERVEEVEAALRPKTCAARPRPSCSRPDGQSIRHWVREPWWTNEGLSCDDRERLEPGDG